MSASGTGCTRSWCVLQQSQKEEGSNIKKVELRKMEVDILCQGHKGHEVEWPDSFGDSDLQTFVLQMEEKT